jgi:two-component system chemotaxis sensor kinase CheA
VDLRKLDRLLHLAGEIAVIHGRLTGAAERGGGLDRQELLEVHGALDPLLGQLQERVTELRMVPVGPLFRQQGRAIHDLAAAQGKLVRLSLEGEEVEVDAAVIEQLGAPLTHLIRNAVDHGIETPDERRRAGKDACGEIVLRAFHSAGQVVVEVRDDGAGLDRARVEARARELGRGDTAELPDADLFQLLFEPGFSTAAAVTGVSGRGVGLDVVRRHAEALRGTVGLDGQPGRGAVFTLRIPLTLAIIEGLTVEAGGETFVLPLDRVVECVDLAAAEAERARPAGLFHLRGTPLPYLRLRELFALGGAAPHRENLVVVEGEGGLAGVAVDSLRGKSQTVIQPLGRLFRGIPGISGSAVLGNGRVALILDVPALLRNAARRSASLANAPA